MTTNDTERSFGPPTLQDVLIPPFVGLTLIVSGVLIYSLATQPRWWRHTFCRNSVSTQSIEIRTNHLKTSQANSICVEAIAASSNSSIFSSEDIQTLYQLRMFQNNPRALLKLCLPALVSVGVCPIVVVFQPAILDYFYPKYIGGRINTNDSLAVFLLPAGLIYAMTFGFALQDALAKLDVTSCTARRHIFILKQCRELIHLCQALTSEQMIASCRHLCRCTTQWMRREMTSQTEPDMGKDIYSIIKILQSCQASHSTEEKIVDSLLDKLMELDSVMEEGYTGARTNFHLIQWAFMEMLGFIAFFGILLIVAHSYRLELTMCGLTVFSISAFVYILSDLNTAYHGTFKVDLSVFVTFLENINEQYLALKSIADKQRRD